MPDPLPIETLSLPTPYAVGPVNCYILGDDALTMIDAGVNTVDAENALKLGFASRGFFIESVERILVTHGHPDHYGLIPEIRRVSHADSFMGELEIRRHELGSLESIGHLLSEAGFPTNLMEELTDLERKAHRYSAVAALDCKPIKDGDIFEFRDFMLMAVALPGHTGGHMGFLEPATATLFGGDTLLPDTTPNPILEPEFEDQSTTKLIRRKSLKQFLDSLDRLASLNLSKVYPGHGPVIHDPGATIDYMREHHQRRLDVVHNALSWEGMSAYGLSQHLYPTANGYNHFLAISEVIAHLDVLVEEGRAIPDVRVDGVEYFAKR